MRVVNRCSLLLQMLRDLTVGHDNEPCKHGWTDRVAACGVDSEDPGNQVLGAGPRYPARKGALEGGG